MFCASLAKHGARVGILDADIYGPSLPTMISPEDRRIRPSRKFKNYVEPVEYEGVKCMSFGFVNQSAAPGAGGTGHTKELATKYNLENIFKLPISEQFSSSSDSGRPFVLSGLSSDEMKTFDTLAITVAKKLVVLRHTIRLEPELSYDKNRGIVFRLYGRNEAKEVVLHPADLRARQVIRNRVEGLSMALICGNYAFAVVWSDGHTSSLYTYDTLTKLIDEYASESVS
ncbi:hypothetical protein PsorP6_009603 [Peronosclerospora sorghi]|uniref:Uncharacterized protein n=1 Tax=Peronosclerospora sorghi TaxID=230839 RepID=A0ACC0VXW1_9STRA|nr:hypothetical protein PsorP6_009603 [Peronosclerospora sorghi]